MWALSAAGDPLERLAAVVDFELFRPELDAALARSDRAEGAARPTDTSKNPVFRTDRGLTVAKSWWKMVI
jgi:hypothetical protein